MQNNTRNKNALAEKLVKKMKKKELRVKMNSQKFISDPLAVALSRVCSLFMVNGINK